MALTNNGTQVLINDNNIPSGYTKPTVTTFQDHESTYPNRSISVAKSGVENASDVTTFTALVAQVTSDVSTLITADYDVTNTVDVYSNIKSITTNAVNGDALYTDDAVNYICIVDIFIKTS